MSIDTVLQFRRQIGVFLIPFVNLLWCNQVFISMKADKTRRILCCLSLGHAICGKRPYQMNNLKVLSRVQPLRILPAGEQFGLLTRTATTESVSLHERTK